MQKREVVKLAIKGKKVPYVPWACTFTKEANNKLKEFYGNDDIDKMIDNHIVRLGNDVGFFEDIGDNRFKDVFGVVWNRTVDKDIGNVEGCVLPEPILKGYQFPDPVDRRYYEDIPEKINKYQDCFRIYAVGFSLYERAWSLRGMENLMMDFIINPDFVHQLLAKIVDYNIAHIREALKYDIDAIYFGDDWGQQTGLQIGPKLWKEFLKPELRRMYSVVKDANKYIMIHSCGKVDELFDDLVEIGVDCFNPFQPEVMNIFQLMEQFKGRLAFHGGLSTQQILPYGCVEDVKNETEKLLEAGKNGGYIFAPAHAVEGDVNTENMLAFIEVLKSQKKYKKSISSRNDFMTSSV